LGSLYSEVYDITTRGNFEGKNIPNLIKTDLSKIAKSFNLTEKDVQTQLETARKKLYSEREKRVHPYKDDKILTSWNMLMIAAFAKAGRA
ncbi:hypothetical protein R0K17_24545, partial [Planococcus sp. SIMBA_143]